MRRFLLFALAAVASGQDVDRVEARTEEIANALLDFAAAARARDRARLASFVRADVRAAPLAEATPAKRERVVKWIARHGWRLERQARAMTREEFADDLLAFLERHGTVEDFRLAVVRDGGLKWTLVGRNPKGERVWTRGRVRATFENARIASFHVEALETLVATRDLFTDVAQAAGVAATDPPTLDHKTLGLAAYGAAAADVNRDGLIDVLSTGRDGNVLYLNRGDGGFRPVAVPTPRLATGPLFLDYDNDGDPDLFCSANGKQMLLENRFVPDGRLLFRDVSVRTGVAKETIGFSAVAGDLNGDRVPDIYVTAYNDFGPVLPDSWDNATNGLPNLLFVSQADGTYAEVAKKWGAGGRDWSYAAQIVDVDADGRLDLYVANDFGSGNRLLLNRGDRFEDDAARRGVQESGYAMGVSFGDHDNDGDLDLHVTKMSSTAGNRILDRLDGRLPGRLRPLASGNSLYENDGRGFFKDVSARAGPFPAGWAWGGGFWDFDNDGWEDLHTPNGHMSGLSMKDT